MILPIIYRAMCIINLYHSISLTYFIAVTYSFLCLQSSFRAERRPEEIDRLPPLHSGWYQRTGGDKEGY